MKLKNYLEKNSEKYCLVGKIKGLAEENKRASLFIKNGKFKPEKVWVLFKRKDTLSISIRYHLLAYAFLSGKRYSSLEAKCGENNSPSATRINEIIGQHLPQHIITYHSIGEKSITEWLET
jgi:hypothetical protein